MPTPSLVVDEARLDRNLGAMQRLAEAAGVRLRPHLKTHKCPDLARRQRALGAHGLCAAKTGEAAVFAAAGFDDLLLAYPLLGEKAERLAALAADRPGSWAAVADSRAGLEALSRAATRRGVRLGIWLKVDSGLHRCGLEPDDPRLAELAHAAHASPGLRLQGLLTHAGQVYAADPSEVEAIGLREGRLMVEAARRLEREGLGPLEVGLGATPTVPFAATVEGVDEIHPGVYVFGDRQQVRLGAMLPDHLALSVLATVVSRPAPGRWVIDAGSKTFSSDRGAHGTEGVVGYGVVRRPGDHRALGSVPPFGAAARAAAGTPDAAAQPSLLLTRLSEEHGIIESDAPAALEPGDRVEVVPNHACAAVNLAETLYLARGLGVGREVVETWPVAARARVR